MRWSPALPRVGNAIVDGADRGWQCDRRRRCRAAGNVIVDGTAARLAIPGSLAPFRDRSARSGAPFI
jgi:hypothetical protein